MNSHVRLPRSQASRFPNRCVVCGQKQPDHVPECERCGIRLALGSVLVFLTTLVLAVVACLLIINNMNASLETWFQTGAIIGIGAILWVAVFWWDQGARRIKLTAHGDWIDYEFRDAAYAAEFAALNDRPLDSPAPPPRSDGTPDEGAGLAADRPEANAGKPKHKSNLPPAVLEQQTDGVRVTLPRGSFGKWPAAIFGLLGIFLIVVGLLEPIRLAYFGLFICEGLARCFAALRWGVVTVAAGRLKVKCRTLLCWQRRSWTRESVRAVAAWHGLRVVDAAGTIQGFFGERDSEELAQIAGLIRDSLQVPAELVASEGEVALTFTGPYWKDAVAGVLQARAGTMVLYPCSLQGPYLKFRAGGNVLSNWWLHGALTVLPSDIHGQRNVNGQAVLELAPADVCCRWEKEDEEDPLRRGSPFLDALPPWTRLSRPFSSPGAIVHVILGMAYLSWWALWGSWSPVELVLVGLVVLFLVYEPFLWGHGLSSWKEPLHLTLWSNNEEALYNAVARFWGMPAAGTATSLSWPSLDAGRNAGTRQETADRSNHQGSRLKSC